MLPFIFLTGFLAGWSALHSGYDPSGNRLVFGWLRLVHRAALPAARLGLAPSALTGLGLLLSALVPVLCVPPGGWPLLAMLVLVAAGMADALDGAVALLTGRVSRFGAVLDAVTDRVGEACYLLALWLLGAPGWVCVVAGVLTGLLEYVRASAIAAGMPGIGVVTVWERPTRIIVIAVGLALAGVAGLVAAYVVGSRTGYGSDNSCMLDTIARGGGRFRGIAPAANVYALNVSRGGTAVYSSDVITALGASATAVRADAPAASASLAQSASATAGSDE